MVEPTDLSPDQRRAVIALLQAEQLDPSYFAFVARHLDAADRGWRWCCGSNCDPCVTKLGRVVDAARRELGPTAGLPERTQDA